MRVQAEEHVVETVRRDAVDVAVVHGAKEPEGGLGSRIITTVRVPTGPDDRAVVVTGDAVHSYETLAVVTVHARAEGRWTPLVHRLAVANSAGGEVRKASAWARGPWGGDTLLSSEFDEGFPPEANPS